MSRTKLTTRRYSTRPSFRSARSFSSRCSLIVINKIHWLQYSTSYSYMYCKFNIEIHVLLWFVCRDLAIGRRETSTSSWSVWRSTGAMTSSRLAARWRARLQLRWWTTPRRSGSASTNFKTTRRFSRPSSAAKLRSSGAPPSSAPSMLRCALGFVTFALHAMALLYSYFVLYGTWKK